MSDADTDRDLRVRFGELRARDTARVPAFERTLARTRRPHPRAAWWPAWTAVAAGLTAAAIWLAPREPIFAPEPVETLSSNWRSPTEWRSPTDFLLQSPDDDLLRLAWAPTVTSEIGRLEFPQEEKR